MQPFPIYRVSRHGKEPLLAFLLDGLRERGCRILFASPADHEPFQISFETASGERIGVLCYAFFANSRETKNRPEDEHRFQVKLGSDPRRLLRMHDDPSGLWTTLFVGIDPDRGFLVAADPLLHNPSPMFKSIEFKRHHAEATIRKGWLQWERDRRAHSDQPIEVLVGATKARLLDLIRFERAARGLDQGHRQLLAEKFGASTDDRKKSSGMNRQQHRLIDELGLEEAALFDLINDTSRLKMAVRGWVAEVHLEEKLRTMPGVSECHRIKEEGRPDISLRWHGSKPIYIECKNVLRKTASGGAPRMDFQRTRASKADPCSRYYRPSDFGVVAACLHAVTEIWEFRFAETRALPSHPKCAGRIGSSLTVASWLENPADILDTAAKHV